MMQIIENLSRERSRIQDADRNTTIFLVGNESTLPIHIFSMLRFGITPKINAISVVLIVVTVVLGFFSDKFSKQE